MRFMIATKVTGDGSVPQVGSIDELKNGIEHTVNVIDDPERRPRSDEMRKPGTSVPGGKK